MPGEAPPQLATHGSCSNFLSISFEGVVRARILNSFDISNLKTVLKRRKTAIVVPVNQNITFQLRNSENAREDFHTGNENPL